MYNLSPHNVGIDSYRLVTTGKWPQTELSQTELVEPVETGPESSQICLIVDQSTFTNVMSLFI